MTNAAPAPRVVVVGVGNRWRRDDGAGPAVAGAVRARCGAAGRVEVLELDGEAARLIDAWDGADLAVVVDAVSTGAAPGSLHRLDPDGPRGDRTASSHGLGVRHAVALARALRRLPRRLVLVGVEGGDFGHGPDLTAPVAAAIEPAARLVARVVEAGPDGPDGP